MTILIVKLMGHLAGGAAAALITLLSPYRVYEYTP
jgi:hypothetical protein